MKTCMTHKNRLLLNRVTGDERFQKAWFSIWISVGTLERCNRKVRVNLYQSCDDAIKDAAQFEPRNQQLCENPSQAICDIPMLTTLFAHARHNNEPTTP